MKINNLSNDTTEILLYGVVDAFEISANAVANELKNIRTPNIVVGLNSPGGDVFEGVAIHNLFKNHSAHIEMRIDSLAASIMSFIALAGDKISISDNAFIMIHEVSSGVLGTAKDMRDQADTIDKIQAMLITSYATRTGESEENILNLMTAETWFSAEEAIEIGLADEIHTTQSVENSFDLSIFNNVPKILKNTNKKRSPKVLERALRDVGLSNKEAKAVLAQGYNAIHRDDGLDSLCDFFQTLNKQLEAQI